MYAQHINAISDIMEKFVYTPITRAVLVNIGAGRGAELGNDGDDCNPIGEDCIAAQARHTQIEFAT